MANEVIKYLIEDYENYEVEILNRNEIKPLGRG